jgi:hypothetical protein
MTELHNITLIINLCLSIDSQWQGRLTFRFTSSNVASSFKRRYNILVYIVFIFDVLPGSGMLVTMSWRFSWLDCIYTMMTKSNIYQNEQHGDEHTYAQIIFAIKQRSQYK